MLPLDEQPNPEKYDVGIMWLPFGDLSSTVNSDDYNRLLIELNLKSRYKCIHHTLILKILLHWRLENGGFGNAALNTHHTLWITAYE